MRISGLQWFHPVLEEFLGYDKFNERAVNSKTHVLETKIYSLIEVIIWGGD